MQANLLKIGTCSWKYPSWQGLVYSPDVGDNDLAEYARQYETVEIDQLEVILLDLMDKGIFIYLNVNNHFEGSAPLTIRRIQERMSKKINLKKPD